MIKHHPAIASCGFDKTYCLSSSSPSSSSSSRYRCPTDWCSGSKPETAPLGLKEWDSTPVTTHTIPPGQRDRPFSRHLRVRLPHSPVLAAPILLSVCPSASDYRRGDSGSGAKERVRLISKSDLERWLLPMRRNLSVTCDPLKMKWHAVVGKDFGRLREEGGETRDCE
jgi:hypothetical protein